MTNTTLFSGLGIAEEQLKPVVVSKFQLPEIGRLKGFTYPGQPYQNALEAARMLNADAVVYGVATVGIGVDVMPLAHAWIRVGNRYFDPTYQLLGGDNGVFVEQYLKLFEIDLSDYSKVCERELGHIYGLIAPDLYVFRSAKAYQTYFTSRQEVA